MLLTADMCLGDQWKAIQFFEGAADVISGPGTGKTTTISNRIARLVTEHGVEPARILALTFNKDAQLELKDRSTKLLLEAGAQLESSTNENGEVSYSGADCRTYHSLGYLIARNYLQLNKFDPVLADATWIARTILSDGKMPDPYKGYNGPERWGMGWNKEGEEITIDPKDMIKLMDSMKENMVLPSKVREYFIEMLGPEHDDLDNYLTFYRMFHEELRLKGKLTFADMLFAAWLVLTNQPAELKRIYKTNGNIGEIGEALSIYQRRWDFYVVDEAQDTNPLQGEVVTMLARRTGNIMVCGDSDQSIYSFRGARPDYIQGIMERHYPQRAIYFLDHTRRFVQQVVDVSNKLIAFNPRLDNYSPLKTARTDEGTVTAYDFLGGEIEQAQWFANEILTTLETDKTKSFDDFGIIARTNATIAMIEPVLFSREIVYRVLGGGSVYNRAEVKKCMGFVASMVGAATVEEIVECMNVARHDNPKGTHYLGDAANETVKARCGRDKDVPANQVVENIAFGFTGPEIKSYIKRGLQSFCILVKEMRQEANRLGIGDVVTSLEYVQAARKLAVDNFVKKQYGEREDDGDSRYEVLVGLEHLALQYPDVQTFVDVVRRLQADADKPKDEQAPAVRLGTGHRWKGLEADTIMIASMSDSVFPHMRADGFHDGMQPGYQSHGINEERRLAFVAVTRAKNRLIIGRLGRSLFCEEMGLVPVVADEELEAILDAQNRELRTEILTGDIEADADAVAEEFDALKAGLADEKPATETPSVYRELDAVFADIGADPDGWEDDIAALDALMNGAAIPVPTVTPPAPVEPPVALQPALITRGITDLLDPSMDIPTLAPPIEEPVTPMSQKRISKRPKNSQRRSPSKRKKASA